jgi:hypothetical protein
MRRDSQRPDRIDEAALGALPRTTARTHAGGSSFPAQANADSPLHVPLTSPGAARGSRAMPA